MSKKKSLSVSATSESESSVLSESNSNSNSNSNSSTSNTESNSESNSGSSSSKNTAITFIKLQYSPTTEIRYVYHLSDIHIRNNDQRYAEYKDVFEKTYAKIESEIGSNQRISLIVLTGDILHAKTELSPESISLTYHFLKKLSQIVPVILIPGNHDCNLSNRHRLDALSPIVNDVGNLQNLYYLKNSGFYQYHNIIFGVTSIFDQVLLTANKITADMWKSIKQKNKYKIGLYHGAVHSAKTDVGFRMNNEELLVDDFDGYDYVMLGDIHRFQYMNEKKTIAYAGSLIQQSYGESVRKHGILKWDLRSSESEFLEISNDYGYCTVTITDGKIAPNTVIVPKPRIRFILENTNQLQYQDIVKKLEKKYEICEIVKDSNFKTKIHTLKTSDKKKSVTASTSDAHSTQENIIRAYLLKNKLDPTKIESIMDLHKKIYQKTLLKKKDQTNDTIPSSIKSQKWKILELKFSNTLSYGKDNIIDFRKYNSNQIIGIMAPNRYGKSAILDIILFCLFDKMSRGERRDILNKNQNSMFCSLLFGIGKIQYLIERIGQRSKNGLNVKIDVNFYMIKPDKSQKKLNGLDKNDTNKKITELIGDYNDYLTTCFCLQNSKQNNFIDMTQLQKKEYLNEILKLNVFEDCHNDAKDTLKELIGQMKLLEKRVSTKSLEEIREDVLIVSKEIAELTNVKSGLEMMITENLDGVIELYKTSPLCQYNELAEYTIDTEDRILNQIEKLKLTAKKIPCINIEKIKAEIAELNALAEKNDDLIKSANAEIRLRSLHNQVEKLLRQIITVSKTHSKTNIDDLVDEKEKIIDRISQIDNILRNMPANLNEKINLINKLKIDIGLLKKKLKNVDTNHSVDIIKLHNDLINSQHDTLVLCEETAYDLSPEAITDIKQTIKIYDKFTCHVKLNIDDLTACIETNGTNELNKILEREITWLENYTKWKTQVLKIINKSNSQPKEKILSTTELSADIISKTFDVVSYWDDVAVHKQIESKKCTLENLSEYNGSKKEQDILQQERVLLEQKLVLCETHIVNATSYNKHTNANNEIYLQINELKSQINCLEADVKQLEHSKAKIKSDISDLEKLLAEYHSNITLREKIFRDIKLLNEYYMTFISQNHLYDMKKKYSDMKKNNNAELAEITNKIIQKTAQKESLKKDLVQYLECRKEFDDKAEEMNLYQLYVKSMDYNGLPYEILKDYLPLIGADINQILHSMVNFDIEFMFHDESQLVEQKSKQLKSNAGCVNINICHPARDGHQNMKPYNVQLGSGFEKFIIGLAIRMTLGQISLTAKPNFLIIDEGWSCLDSDYKNDIPTIMSYIKNQYEHVIIISHMEELKTQADYIINIEKINNYSYVNTKKNKLREKSSGKKKKSDQHVVTI